MTKFELEDTNASAIAAEFVRARTRAGYMVPGYLRDRDAAAAAGLLRPAAGVRAAAAPGILCAAPGLRAAAAGLLRAAALLGPPPWPRPSK